MLNAAAKHGSPALCLIQIVNIALIVKILDIAAIFDVRLHICLQRRVIYYYA